MSNALKMSIKKFERMGTSLGPCELVRGKVVPLSYGEFLPCRAASNIMSRLHVFSDKEKHGRVLGNNAGLITDEKRGTVRGVDVLYISFERKPKRPMNDDFLRVAPELVVEIKNRDDTRSGLKQVVDEYHAMGVDLVWVVDPKKRSIRIYPKGEKPILMGDHETITGGKVLPKFKCKIARFFEF